MWDISVEGHIRAGKSVIDGAIRELKEELGVEAKEKDFANTIASEQVLVPNGGHINSESGYDTFEDIVSYL